MLRHLLSQVTSVENTQDSALEESSIEDEMDTIESFKFMNKKTVDMDMIVKEFTKSFYSKDSKEEDLGEINLSKTTSLDQRIENGAKKTNLFPNEPKNLIIDNFN